MKKVLVVLSEWGYWGEELVGPLEVLDAHGYEATFVTPKGQRAHALPPSMTAGYWDPPLDNRKSIIAGKHVTGHALEYDYKDGTGFLNTDFNMGPPPYPLELILRDAVGPNGQYHGGVGRTRSTILDYPFLTGRSTQDSRLVGELMIEVLERGLKHYGW